MTGNRFTSPPLSVIVVGVGHMGAIHAAKVRQLEQLTGTVRLVGIAERRADRGGAMAAALGTMAATDHRCLLPNAGAAIVAVPTPQHYAVARDAILAGLDVLVEKPIAATLAEAEALCAEATRYQRILQVGHLEYFNPAFTALRTLVTKPHFIATHRTSQPRQVASDTDVVHDLMIHDLHLALQLIGEEPIEVSAVGQRGGCGIIDRATANLRFPSGCVARFSACRTFGLPKRVFKIRDNEKTIVADFQRQDVVASRPSSHKTKVSFDRSRTVQAREDTALLQLAAFVRATRIRDAGMVAGVEVLKSMRTASQIVAAISEPPADRRRERAGLAATS